MADIMTRFDEHISKIGQYTPLKGKRVLEIGGDRWLNCAKAFVRHGAVSVETTNIVKGWPDFRKEADNITLRRVDANRLEDTYEAGSFDIVFGLAVAEHIPEYWNFLRGCQHVLSPDGLLYFHGGPIWTSSFGHHVWLTVDGVDYHFTNKNTPIKRWEHLMHDQESLASLLEGRGLPLAHAAAVSDFIYNSNDQNRYGYSKQMEIFRKSPLHLVEQVDNAFVLPNEEELAAIVARGYPSEERFDVSGVTVIMRPSASI